MTVFRELRRRARQVAPQVLLASTLAYFGYHAVEGDRGVLARIRLEQDLVDAHDVRATLGAERARLEHRVALLRPDGLDPDLLEERARGVLNLGYPEDFVILLPKAPLPRESAPSDTAKD
jgi:cell division protein FtsB